MIPDFRHQLFRTPCKFFRYRIVKDVKPFYTCAELHCDCVVGGADGVGADDEIADL